MAAAALDITSDQNCCPRRKNEQANTSLSSVIPFTVKEESLKSLPLLLGLAWAILGGVKKNSVISRRPEQSEGSET